MSSKLKVRRRGGLAFLAIALPFLLSGCFKFTMDLEVSSDDKISGTAVVALSKELAGFAEETGGEDATDVFAETEGVTASEFDDGDFVGQQYEFAGVPIEELDFQDETGGLTITRDGDFLNVAGDLNFEDDSAQAGGDDFGFGQAFFDSADLRVSIKFPGEVRETNGELDEETNTVTWLPKYGQANEISATVYSPQGIPLWVWITIGSSILGLLLLLTVSIALQKKRNSAPIGSMSLETPSAPSSNENGSRVPLENIRFSYLVKGGRGLSRMLGKPSQNLEVVLARDFLRYSFVDSKSGALVETEDLRVEDISDAVYLSDAQNGMAVRLTVRGGIVDIPATPGDGKTLVKLLKKPQTSSRQESPSVARQNQEATSPLETLERLHLLKEQGVISEEEFLEKKNEILRRL